MKTNEDGLTMEAWLTAVDRHVLALCGLTHGDLADFPIWDLWADGVAPAEAAAICLVDWNDFPEDLLGGAL